jgi:hypothetical protein
VSQASTSESRISRSGTSLSGSGLTGVGKTSVARDSGATQRADRHGFGATSGRGAGDRQAPGVASQAGGWGRLARHVVLPWLGHFLSVRPALRRGALVVGGRRQVELGYLVQPDTLRFYGSRRLAALALQCSLARQGRKRHSLGREIRSRELSEEKTRYELARERAFGCLGLVTISTGGRNPSVARQVGGVCPFLYTRFKKSG